MLPTVTKNNQALVYTLVALDTKFEAGLASLAQHDLANYLGILDQSEFAGVTWATVQVKTMQELELDTQEYKKLQTQLQEIFEQLEFDWFDLKTVQPSLEKPGLWVTDMDMTAVNLECLDRVADLAGSGEKVAAITKKAMSGHLNFKESLIERVQTLAGKSAQVLSQIASMSKPLPINPGVKETTALLKENGWEVAIASGGFTYFAELARRQTGMDTIVCNEFEIVDGKFTGALVGDIVGREEKAMFLKISSLQAGLELGQTIATGDGANDLDMLKQAAWGVAFHPSFDAKAQGFIGNVIKHSSLAAIGAVLISKQFYKFWEENQQAKQQ